MRLAISCGLTLSSQSGTLCLTRSLFRSRFFLSTLTCSCPCSSLGFLFLGLRLSNPSFVFLPCSFRSRFLPRQFLSAFLGGSLSGLTLGLCLSTGSRNVP